MIWRITSRAQFFFWRYASKYFDFDLARTINVASGSRVQVVLLTVFGVRVGVSETWLYGSCLTVFAYYSYGKSVNIPKGAYQWLAIKYPR